MTRGWRIMAGAIVLGMAGVGCHVAAPPAPPTSMRPAAARATDGEVRELARLVNEHRVRRGKPRLVWDERLARVAQAHSDDMARRRYFSHTNPDGRDPFERLRVARVHFRAAAENIGEGQRDAEEMLADWLASRGHRRNLENGVYTHHGIGLSRDRHWTHVFASFAARR